MHALGGFTELTDALSGFSNALCGYTEITDALGVLQN